jgi:23S rRNA (adenine2503-C2)-methyltransferase
VKSLSLRDYSLSGFEKWALKEKFEPFRAKQICDWLYKKDALSVQEMTNLPEAMRTKLAQQFSPFSLQCVRQTPSQDGSIKFLFEVEGKEFVESVLIPSRGRLTLCVSTQVGCPIRCTFCASGLEGLKRNLSAAEILDQVSFARRNAPYPLTNIVYMGMGEPFLNYDAVIHSVRTLMAPWGYALSGRRITISTSGIVPGIERFLNEKIPLVQLSLSLHAGRDALRTELMPINKKYPIKSLIQALKKGRTSKTGDYTLEYTLLKEVNDTVRDARELASIAKQTQAKVNLIAYNPVQGQGYQRLSRGQMEAFKIQLEREGVRATIRYSAGSDIGAACGQLRLVHQAQKALQ